MITSPPIRPALALLGLAGLALAAPANANDWYRYENSHFIAWSNANERRVRQLLDELESFRAAFATVSNIEVPADAPKTAVLITRNRAEFSAMAPGRNVAGFALRGSDRTLIVMPGASAGRDSRATIRHEYGHALMFHQPFRYPSWYEEGFAEIMGAIELVDRGQAFVIGTVPDRAKYNGPPLVDWDALISDGFNLHAIPDRAVGSSAYAQSWLLAHYATFGDKMANARKLQRYLNLLREGVASSAAFAQAFGAAPAELWQGELRSYARQVPGYRVEFRADSLDPEFSRIPADEAEFRGAVDFLRLQSAALTARRPPDGMLDRLSGHWDWLALEGSCESPLALHVDPERRQLVVAPVDTDGGRSEVYNFEPQGRAALRLLSGSPPQAWRLEMRSEDLLCWSPAHRDDLRCGRIMRRCPAG